MRQAQAETSGAAVNPKAGLLSLLTLFSRVLGMAREIVKARFLGTSTLSDAFSVAFLIPNLFRRLFAEGSIAVAFIPTFKAFFLREESKDRDNQAIAEFLSCMVTFLTFFVSLAVGVGILCAPLIVPIFKFPPEAFDETVLLTRLLFPFLAFISIAAFFQGILNSLHRFTPSGVAPILLNVAVILAAYLLTPLLKNPARAMAVGILVGGFLEMAVQFPFVLAALRKTLGLPAFSLRFTSIRKAAGHEGVKRVLRLIAPTVAGMAAYQLNDLVSTALAAAAGEGVVSSLQYSLRLQELLLGVFAVSIGTVLLPDLADDAKSRRWQAFNERLRAALCIIALLMLPMTAFALAHGEAIIRLLFQNRRFGEESVALTLAAFTFHIPGLFFIAVNRIVAPAFYAQSDSRSPSFAGILSFALNMLLALILVRPLSGAGIALALSLAGAVNTFLLLFFLGRKKRGDLKAALKGALRYALKIAAFSVAALLPALLVRPHLNAAFAGAPHIVAYGAPLAIAAILYAAAGIALLLVTGDPYIAALLRRRRRNSEKPR